MGQSNDQLELEMEGQPSGSVWSTPVETDARLGELTCWGTTHVYCQSLPGDPVLMS